MNQELIRIIAAYWGVECSFETFIEGAEREKAIMDPLTLKCIETDAMPFFKLHLRPLWGITEEELRELCEVLPFQSYAIRTNNVLKEMNSQCGDDREFVFGVGSDGGFTVNRDYAVQIINHLRLKGFCLDQSLIDAGLIEWV